MPFIEVKSGAGVPEGWKDGVYPVILSDIVGPKTVTAQRGPKAGQEIDLFDWQFVIEAGPFENTGIAASTSTASGPRSKMYAFLTALFGGAAPPVGTKLEKEQIVGRSALATIQLDDDGWLRITNLGAMPQAAVTGAQTAPAAPGGPEATAPAAGPLKEQVARQSGSLPF